MKKRFILVFTFILCTAALLSCSKTNDSETSNQPKTNKDASTMPATDSANRNEQSNPTQEGQINTPTQAPDNTNTTDPAAEASIAPEQSVTDELIPLRMDDEHYIILHGMEKDGQTLPDQLITKDGEIVASFPGKFIEDFNQSVCKKDDILILRTVLRHDEDWDEDQYGYELYSLKDQAYITTQSYEFIYKTENGLFLCRGDVDPYNRLHYTCYNPTGKLLLDFHASEDNPDEGMTVAKDHLFCLANQVLKVYDVNGQLLTEEPFLYYEVEFNDFTVDFYQKESEYVFVRVNHDYLIILDSLGHEVDLHTFLSKLMKKEQMPDYWITACMKGADGSLYAAGTIDDTLYVLRQDGTILYQMKNPENKAYAVMQPQWITVYNQDFIGTNINIDGTVLAPTTEELARTNDNLIVFNENGFTAYDFSSNQSYVVNVQDYKKESVEASEAMTSQEFTAWRNHEDKYLQTFKGLRFFDEYINYKKVDDDNYIITHFDDTKDFTVMTYELMDGQGKTLYEAPAGEEIIGVIIGQERYVVVKAGMMLGIKDLKGNLIYHSQTM